MDILLESEHIVATTALTFLYTIFILLGRQDRSMRETKRTMTVIEDQLKVYISWKFIVSAVSGFIIGFTLSHLGIDLAAVFGLLTVSAHQSHGQKSVLRSRIPTVSATARQSMTQSV